MSEGTQSKPVDSPAQRPVVTPGPAFAHMGLGLLLFGVVIGLVTGLSSKDGTAQSLLTSIFGFVGGSLLTFAGFRRYRGGAESVEMDPRKVGLGLSCFSVGILLGLFVGMLLRLGVIQVYTGMVEIGRPQPPSEMQIAPDAGAVATDAATGGAPDAAGEAVPANLPPGTVGGPDVPAARAADVPVAAAVDSGRKAVRLSLQNSRDLRRKCDRIRDDLRDGVYENTPEGQQMRREDETYVRERCGGR
jgi:hypothetical protein